LFRINAIISADNTPFEEVRDELRTELAGERARRLVADLVDEIDDELAAGIELEELSKIPGLQVGTINFNEKSNHPLADYEAFRSAAYASQKEDFAEILDLSDGGVFALRLDSIEEPTQIAQAAIGAKLEDDFKVAQTNEALMKLAKQVKPDLESGGNLDSRDVKLETVENITRNSYIETLPPRAITKVFEMELGDVSLIETSGTVFLVRLTKINNFDPDQKDNQLVLNEVKQQIDAQISLDILDYYSESLQSKVGVTLNRNVIEQVNLQITGVEPTGY
jgi:peptidyl-prolyl cis-trans isomerase D